MVIPPSRSRFAFIAFLLLAAFQGPALSTPPVLDPIPAVVSAINAGANTVGTPFVTTELGSLTINANGSYVYVPAAGVGPFTDTIPYTITGRDGLVTNSNLVLTGSKGGPKQTGTLITSQVPAGKTLVIPITASDAENDPLSFTVTSTNPKIMARIKTGNPYLRLNISYAGDGGPTPAFTGALVLQLYRDMAPMTVDIIAGLARAGYYDNLTFHRVIPDFMIQGGDPVGDGSGGPGFKFENEFNPAIIFTGRGQLAMANAGNDVNYKGTNGSQFFITDSSPRHLDFKHTIFGQLVRGFDVLEKVLAVPVNGSDKPLVEDVIITSAVIEENNHDATLLVSATGIGAATLSVVANDGSKNSLKQTFTVISARDTVNSPPFVRSPGNQIVGLNTYINFQLEAVDLEFDYTIFAHGIFVPANVGTSSQDGIFLRVGGFVTGPIPVGLGVTQLDLNYRGAADGPGRSFDDILAFQIGIGGAGIVTGTELLEAEANVPIAGGIVANFNVLNTSTAPGNFTATINWGDGSAIAAGVVTRDPRKPTLNGMVVQGTHTYSRPGLFPVTAEIKDANGLNKSVRSSVVVADPARITAVGQSLAITGKIIANRLLATFTDPVNPKLPADYEADINWGDGKSSAGKITGNGTGLFAVFGTHTYKDPELFPVTVRVHEKGGDPLLDGVAWATIQLSGFKAKEHLPPFTQARLVGYWQTPLTKTTVGSGATGMSFIAGDFVVFNTGNKTSKPSKVAFYLSDNKTLEAGDPSMKIAEFEYGGVGALTAGNGVRFSFRQVSASTDLRIRLPMGDLGTGKNVIAELLYSDPIADIQNIERIVVAGPISGIVVTAVTTLNASGRLVTTEAGGAAQFNVVLDTAPTQNVLIPIASSDTTEGTVSPSVLTFTSGDWNIPQTVTITGASDALTDGDVNYDVQLQPASSADGRFNGMDGTDMTVVNTGT